MKDKIGKYLVISISCILGLVILVFLLMELISWSYPLQKIVYVNVPENDVVTYDELDMPPKYLPTDQIWFDTALAPITHNKLKKYMKENNFVITQGEYVFYNTARFEEIIEILHLEAKTY